MKRLSLILLPAILALGSCTQETQNKFGRAVQNWTGTNGILEVYFGDKLVKRFLNIDKLSTASGTGTVSPGPIVSVTGYSTAISMAKLTRVKPRSTSSLATTRHLIFSTAIPADDDFHIRPIPAAECRPPRQPV